jgi:hypothetical protein
MDSLISYVSVQKKKARASIIDKRAHVRFQLAILLFVVVDVLVEFVNNRGVHFHNDRSSQLHGRTELAIHKREVSWQNVELLHDRRATDRLFVNTLDTYERKIELKFHVMPKLK